MPPSSRLVGGLRFRADPRRPGPGEVEEFRARLIGALALAHGVGGRFEIRWRTGSAGGWFGSAEDDQGGPLSRGIFGRAYAAGTFVRDPRPAAALSMRLRADPVRPSAEPFPPLEGRPWSDALAGWFGQRAEGWEAGWSAVPIAGSGATPPASGVLEAVPVGYRSRREPEPVQRLEELRAARGLGRRWAVSGWIAGPADPARALELGRAISGASRLEGGNGWRFRPLGRWGGGPRPLALSTTELAGLFPSPWSEWAEGGQPLGPAPRRLRLGLDLDGRPVEVPIDPASGRHLVITGETGMGKSTLLAALAVRAARLGTLVVLDPVGDTVRRILAALPLGDRRRADWIALAESPVPSNALRGLASDDPVVGEREIEELVRALREVRSARYPAAPFWGPRIEEVAHWAITAAAALPEGTLATAEAILEGEPGRIPAGLPGPALRAWEAIRSRQHDHPEEVEGGRRLFAEVARGTALRRMLAEPRASWSPARAVAPGALTLLSGDAAAVGESTARTYLAVQLALIWGALARRPKGTPVFLLLDEAPLYAVPVLAELLRLSRRFGAHVLIATQSLAALPDAEREAILTNASDLVLFRGSPSEAREVARWAPGVDPVRLLRMARGEALVLLGKGSELRHLRPARAPAIVLSPDDLRSVAEGTRRRWPLDRREELGGSSDGPGPLALPGDPAPPDVAEVVAALRNWPGSRRVSGEPVLLTELRRRAGLAEAAVRRAGGWLGARGVIESERGAGGTAWRVRWDRLPPPEP